MRELAAVIVAMCLSMTVIAIFSPRAKAAALVVPTSATLKATCMSDGSMRIDSDASTAPR